MANFQKSLSLLIAVIAVTITGVQAQNPAPTLSASPLNIEFLTEVNTPSQQRVNIGLTGIPLLSTLTSLEVNITGENNTQFSVLQNSHELGQILTDLLSGNLGLTVSYTPTAEGNHSATLEVQAKLLGFTLPLKIAIPLKGKTMGILKVDDLTEAYIYGFPLVMAELTKRVLTNVVTPDQVFAPVNQFGHANASLNNNFTAVVGANADTYSSSAWLDLTEEPIVISMPNTNGRYYLLPILDAFSNVFASPGSRTTGTEAQTFLVTGPSWKGLFRQI